MFQDSTGAVAYFDEREDVLVIDDPDVSPSTEVVVHVHSPVDGLWHRVTPNHLRTGCGDPVSATAAVRRETLTNAPTLCLRCFTDYERLLAADADARVRRDTLEWEPLDLRERLDSTNNVNSGKRRK